MMNLVLFETFKNYEF